MLPHINNVMNWQELLTLLGVVSHTTVMPYVIKCPINNCHKSMTLYQDIAAVGGIWCTCDGCNFRGDAVKLAEATWGLDTRTTINKIHTINSNILPVNLTEQYIQQYVINARTRQLATQKMWQDAQNCIVAQDNEEVRYLQRILGLKYTTDKEQWLAGAGMFIGGLDRRVFESVMYPYVAEQSAGAYGQNGKRIFLGANWRNLLAIPFYALPGYHSAFMLIGRNAEIPKDVTFHKMMHVTGLALYDSIKYASDTIFVTQDPILATKLQYKHLQDNTTPAPLVSLPNFTHYKTHTRVWDQIVPRPIFWGPPTGELFRHAMARNAHMLLIGTHGHSLNMVQKTPLTEWLARVKDEARPWQQVLQKLLFKLPPTEGEALLVNAGCSTNEIHDITRNCTAELRDKLSIYIKRDRSCKINSTIVRETTTGWMYDKNLLSDTIVRIDKVVHFNKATSVFLHGRLLHKELVVPFVVPRHVLNNTPVSWLTKTLLPHGVIPRARNCSMILATALALSNPVVIRGYDAIGWQKDDQCFVFSDFAIHNAGEIKPITGQIQHRRNLPGLLLQPPTEWTAAEVAKLPTGAGAPVAWAIIGSVISNIIAPIFGKPTVNTATTGRVASVLLPKLMSLLGCRVKRKLYDRFNRRRVWPLLLTDPVLYATREHACNASYVNNIMLPLDWISAQLLLCDDKWNIIEGRTNLPQIEIDAAIAKILPSFIHYIAKQNFRMPSSCTNEVFLHNVLVWLSYWFTSIGGSGVMVTNALKNIIFSNDKQKDKLRLDAFMQIMCNAFDEGWTVICRAGFVNSHIAYKTIVHFITYDGIPGRMFIPYTALRHVLDRVGTVKPNMHVFVELMIKAELAKEATYNGNSGIEISEELWENEIARWNQYRKYRRD